MKLILFIVTCYIGACFTVHNGKAVATSLDTTTTTPDTDIEPTTTTTTTTTLIPNNDGCDIVPKFSRTYYRAVYMIADNPGPDYVSVPESMLISIISEQEVDTLVKVLEPYDVNFKAELNSFFWILTVIDNLNSTVLNEEKEIIVTLEASLSRSAETASATLIMSLPNQDIKPAPKFVDTFYIVYYIINEEEQHSIQLISNTIAIDSSEEELVNVTLEDYNTNFKLTHDSERKQWNIDLNNNLDNNTLRENTELVIKLIAHLDLSADDDTATLLVKLPPKRETLNFTAAAYTATYSIRNGSSERDGVALDKPIQIIDIDNASQVSLFIESGDPKNYFEVVPNGEQWSLTVKTNLPADVFTTEALILITLRATQDEVSGQAALVIKLPTFQSEDAFDNVKIGLTVAVAVLLVAFLVGIAVYYFKIKPANSAKIQEKTPGFQKSDTSADTGEAYAY